MKFRRLLIAVPLLVAAVQTTHSQQAAERPAVAASAGGIEALDDVIITGTRRTDRTILESTAPVDVFTGSELAAQSTSNMLDTLSSLIPSFIVGQNAISDASSFVRSPSLRGLAGDELLVLLNGKRLNRSALVQVYAGGETELSFGSQGPDIASLPSNAFKSVEVLRDGASAQYGSDAIAGVLNYHLRENDSGVELNARYGKYFPGSFSSDGADSQLGVNWGSSLGTPGSFANLSLELATNDQTIRNPTRPSALAFAQAYPSLASQLPNYPGPVQQFGTPPATSTKILLNSALPLSNGDKVYFFVNFARIGSNESFNYRLPVHVTDSSGYSFGANSSYGTAYLTPCTTSYTGCPAGGFIQGGATYNAAAAYPAGFTPRFYGTTKEAFETVGYKGQTAGELTYDLSVSNGSNSLSLGMRNSLNPSLGPASPKSFDDGGYSQHEYTVNADFSLPWKLASLQSPVFLAGGLEWHHEQYQQTPGDPASFAVGPYAFQPLYSCTGTACTPALNGSGAQIIATLPTGSNGYGGNSEFVSATSRNYALYADAETDVTGDLTLGVATRFENYDTFGSTTLGKLQARWRATNSLALRATASTGFHAPTAGQSNVEVITTGFTASGAQYYQGTYPVTSAAARYYGSKALKPEKSKNLSAGLVYTPTQDLVATLDFYQIDVNDRIGISKSYTVTLADIIALPSLISVGEEGQVQYFTNGFDTRTRGADLVLTHSARLQGGRLATTLAYNYNKSTVPSRNPDVISDARVVDIEHYAPVNRVNLSLNYTLDRFTGSLREAYYGSYRDETDYPGQLFSAKTTTDLDLAYEVAPKFTLALGSRNLFNAFPDRIANNPSQGNTVYTTTGSLGNGSIYPRTGGPFGFNGRFLFVRASVKF